MTRREWEQNARWRALELGDPQGELVTLERRAEATAQSREGLTAAQIKSERLEPTTVGFLRRRVRWLEQLAMAGGAKALLVSLRGPVLPGWWVWGGWLVAVSLGFGLTQLGNERELNLLALPLLGLLLWNGVVMAASLVVELWPQSANAPLVPEGWLGRLLRRLNQRATTPPQSPVAAAVQGAFGELTGEMGGRLLRRRFRAWLHVAAALVALGSITAMFARGWSREYRVVWESTLLGADGAGRFFGGLFGPASRVFGIAIPLEELPALQRGEGHETQPGDALPWLQLYGGTLLLGVVVPRLLLTLVALGRARQELQAGIARQGWPGFAIKLLRRVEGGEENLLVLALGQPVEARVRVRWEEWLRELFGGRVKLDLQHLPEGVEDEWLGLWQPEDGRAVLVFFMATTPEEEVQAQLVRQLLLRLEERHFEPEITLLLDAEALEQRWAASKLASRQALWVATVGALVKRVVVGSEKGVSEVRRDLS
jgi:hypothetical protein